MFIKIIIVLCSVDNRYDNLMQQAAQRRHKLQDSLSLHRLNRDTYIVDSWINEKVGTATSVSVGSYLTLHKLHSIQLS